MNNKIDLAEKARKHFSEMATYYQDSINYSRDNSEFFTNNDFNKVETVIQVLPFTVDEALIELQPINLDWGLLNFASFTRPGGGFITGAMAQEEAICHSSTLYNVLKDFKENYDDNFNKLQNKKVTSLYENWAIYSPEIFFEKADLFVNVLTCAAPNLRNLPTKFPKKTIHEAQYSRCKFILDIFDTKRDSNLILGAFGCGVFKNDPKDIATIFKELIPRYNFKNVVFAIPPGNDNYETFKTIFNGSN